MKKWYKVEFLTELDTRQVENFKNMSTAEIVKLCLNPTKMDDFAVWDYKKMKRKKIDLHKYFKFLQLKQ